MRIAIVAGELSGDLLGAGLIRALKARRPDLEFEGIGGPAMEAEGFRSLYPMESLSVMGLVEVLSRLPELLRIRRGLLEHFSREAPAVFIGIDAPDFNLGLERRLRESGVKTVHYVSPSVWAWRQGRLEGIRRSVDLMLTLFPFEKRFYDEHGVAAVTVGHPAAERLPLVVDTPAYRQRLGLPADVPVVALLPGSRGGEVSRLAPAFADAAALLLRRFPDLRLVAPMVRADLREVFSRELERAGALERTLLVDGQSEAAMGAADCVLLASGTATLEAMLLKRPMVVAYKVAPATYWLARCLRLVKIRRFALPNLLFREDMVPEFIQQAATPAALAQAVAGWLEDPARRRALSERFEAMHRELGRDADARAAEAVLRCLG